MSFFFRKKFIVVVLAIFSASLSAQEIVPINSEDVTRMGIVFAPAIPVDTSSGARYAATVVNSPDSAASLTTPWDGTLVSWNLIPGQSATAGTIIATFSSPSILPLQNTWIDAVSALKGADFELRKDESLYKDGIISKQRLTKTRLLKQQAAFAERTARSHLAQGGFDSAKLEALRNQGSGLGEFYLVAQEDGVLSQRMYNVGSYVEAGQIIATLNAGTRRWVSTHIPAKAAEELEIGHQLSIANSGETLTLRQKDLVIDSSNQTIKLLAEFNANTSFTTGQVLSIVLPPVDNGVLIPDRAVVHTGGETIIYVRTAAGIEARTLELQSIGANYLASEGIAVGEEIAIQGTAVLKGIQLGLGGAE